MDDLPTSVASRVSSKWETIRETVAQLLGDVDALIERRRESRHRRPRRGGECEIGVTSEVRDEPGHGDFLPLVRKLNTLGTRVMLLAWDFKWFDAAGQERETRTAHVLLDEVSYPVMMHQVNR